ncbi:hypothetical protein CVIRNUC_007061 [Coccomyxa viridis]|uniref:Uncharacterized protein n=1 Tax=Coccomyxa viridis TaxID=1274662 RepID=A0AAV1IAW0_9CHLO|nr:hypothetical protein CVIRNUC_007061 [Coccomyxa viridis]
MQDRPQASLKAAGSMARSAAAAVRGSCLGPRVLRQSPAWALSGPALPPAKALFGAFPVCRPPLNAPDARQGRILCAGGLPRLA